jgi:ArsR family transcriptional regulator, arsenate/arsenite/antimonite-responsive transcriptional repressor / arsenate reductase (thioredoxin)
MTTEVDSELRRRSALHAALGDPGRLAIVDALALGDASPSQLQAELGMASNLLAHHVRVLRAAGAVQRVRSEGDRRRSYLTLVPGALATLTPSAFLAAPRIVFVCTENAARSQLAAALWASSSEVPVASAGTHPAAQIHPGALSTARRHDLALRPQTPRRLDEVTKPGDVVITVCDRAHEELPPQLRHTHWSVPDPARDGTDDAFDDALSELSDRIARIAPAIHPARSA